MHNLPAITPFQVFRHRRQILRNPLPFHRENFEKHGDLFRVKPPLGSPVLFTRDPAMIRHVLQKGHRNYEKSPLQTVDMAKYIGQGILTATGDHWRTHRRMIQPAFHRQKLQSLLNTMELTISTELERIAPGKTVDVFPLMGDLAFQVVASSLFSSPDLKEKMEILKDITERNQHMLIREMRQPYLKWWFRASGQIGRHLRYAKEARGLLNGIIEARIKSGEEKDDLLDMLLKARYEDGKGMPRKQLIDEVLILFAAGHETTANALSFALYLLARHPAAQQKAYEEATRHANNLQGLLSSKRKSYIQCCIEEAMRLYPPVYVIDRVALEEDRIGGTNIPKGTLILMSIFELHRNESFWGQAAEFRPERFMETEGKDLGEYYYPFGAGPRMCVGNNFAMYEMILTLAMTLRDFELQSPMEELELNPLISLKPGRVPIVFTSRN